MKTIRLTLLCMLAVLLTGSAFAGTKVAISVCDMRSARFVAIISDILDKLPPEEFDVELENADGKKRTQINDISTMLEDDPDYLIVSAVKSIGLGNILEKAAAQGVKLIMLERFSSDVPTENVLSYIGIDARWAGSACAKLLAERFEGRPARILEIQDEQGTWTTNTYSKGFRDTLCTYDNIQIADVLYGESSRQKTQDALLTYLEENGGSCFDAVFAHDDEEGLGALNAYLTIEDAAVAPIVTIGGEDDALRMLEAGSLYACVCVTPFFGETVAETIRRDLRGEAVDHYQLAQGDICFRGTGSDRKGY